MKNLKTRGNQIKSYKVERTTERYNNNNIDVVHLTVESDQTYKYRVCQDERHPDLDAIKVRLEKELKDSVDNFNNFSVTKYKDREYLFINDGQYTGREI